MANIYELRAFISDADYQFIWVKISFLISEFGFLD